MPIAKALKIDRAIRRNVYAYELFRTYIGRLSFMLPLELEFHAFRVLPSTARLFLDIGATDDDSDLQAFPGVGLLRANAREPGLLT